MLEQVVVQVGGEVVQRVILSSLVQVVVPATQLSLHALQYLRQTLSCLVVSGAHVRTSLLLGTENPHTLVPGVVTQPVGTVTCRVPVDAGVSVP